MSQIDLPEEELPLNATDEGLAKLDMLGEEYQPLVVDTPRDPTYVMPGEGVRSPSSYWTTTTYTIPDGYTIADLYTLPPGLPAPRSR